MAGSRGILAAHQPLVVPMLLRLSHFRINCYVVLVLSKQKGITLVFKTDPLQNVDVSSTFDSIAVLQQYIQREIEEQLREMFREDLPSIIHNLSQRWLATRTKVQAPYLGKKAPNLESMSTPDLRTPSFMQRSQPVGSPSSLPPPSTASQSFARTAYYAASTLPSTPSIPPSIATSHQYRVPRAASIASTSLHSIRTNTPAATPPADPDADSDTEAFDPTYGMRPEVVPNRSEFSSFKRLHGPNRGLAGLAEDETQNSSDELDDRSDPYDLASWDDFVSTPSEIHEQVNPDDYEAIPAVGGGVVLRPRVVHAQSRQGDAASTVTSPITTRSPLGRGLAEASHPGLSLLALRLAEVRAESSRQLFPRVSPLRQELAQSVPSPLPRRIGRRFSGESGGGYFPHVSTPPPSSVVISDRDDDSASQTQSQSPLFAAHPTNRRLSQSQRKRSASPLAGASRTIVLRPGLNDSVTQLGALSQLNQTLSPYTRSLEHVTVRSVPRSTLLPAPEKPKPQKARRKRMYRIGKKAAPAVPEDQAGADDEDEDDVHVARRLAALRERQSSPVPPPDVDFDSSDRDHYFRQKPPMRRRMPFVS